uniref:C2H2-type domain-containing protein n=1 Tax=Takifugu rubripes TaxID=31033 RepID=A0A674NBS6_TAKRU
MEGGQVFEFGGMCRGLMDRSAFSLSAQQMQSTAGSHSLLQETRHSSQNATLTPAPGHHPCFSTTSSLTTGSGCSSAGRPLPALNTSTSVTMKQFLSFPIEAMSPVGLFSNFNMMDPVQKAVINHTFGVTLLPTRKQIISCSVCQLRFNSDSQAEAHYKGSRHAKKLKSQENKTKAKLSVTGESCGSSSSAAVPPVSVIDNSCQHTELSCSLADSSSHLKTLAPHLYSPSPLSSRAGSEPPPSSPPSALPAPAPVTSSLSPPPPPPPPPSSHVSSQDATLPVESEEEKAKKLLYCSLCKVAVNSLSQLEAHNAGSKHKTMLEARSGAGPIKAYPRPGAKLKNGSTSSIKGSGLQNKTFHCQICNVHVNSEIQLKQHISSRRHKDRVAGKPSKPKYSPYNKQQRSSVTVNNSSKVSSNVNSARWAQWAQSSLRLLNHPRSTAFPNVPLYLQSSCRKHQMNNSDVIQLFCYLLHPVFTVPLLVSSEGVGEAPPHPLLHLHAFHSSTILSDPHHLSPFLISLFLHPPPQ